MNKKVLGLIIILVVIVMVAIIAIVIKSFFFAFFINTYNFLASISAIFSKNSAALLASIVSYPNSFKA